MFLFDFKKKNKWFGVEGYTTTSGPACCVKLCCWALSYAHNISLTREERDSGLCTQLVIGAPRHPPPFFLSL